MRFGSQIAVRGAITAMTMRVYMSTKLRGNNGRERQCFDREKGWQVTMWNPTENGEKLIVTLENVKYVPELWINLFSIGKALKYGFNLSNDGEIIKLSNGNVTLTFDKVMRTKNGFVPEIKLLQVLGDVGTSILGTKKRDTIDVNNLHKILGHCGEVNARLTGKAYGYEVTGEFDVCEACSIAKARQKTSTKNGKEEAQSMENACMLTIAQSKELVLVDLNFGH
jgi:hypothetical protein